MDATIKNLSQTLAFELEGIYDLVKLLQSDLSNAIKLIEDVETRNVFNDYRRSLGDQRLKLKRIFGYLLNGPYGRKSGGTIARWDEIGSHHMLPSLRDLLFSTSLRQEIQHIINVYNDARFIAMRLDLDTVVQLIDEILDGEEAFALTLKRISSTQVNQACLLTTN